MQIYVSAWNALQFEHILFSLKIHFKNLFVFNINLTCKLFVTNVKVKVQTYTMSEPAQQDLCGIKCVKKCQFSSAIRKNVALYCNVSRWLWKVLLCQTRSKESIVCLVYLSICWLIVQIWYENFVYCKFIFPERISY